MPGNNAREAEIGNRYKRDLLGHLLSWMCIFNKSNHFLQPNTSLLGLLIWEMETKLILKGKVHTGEVCTLNDPKRKEQQRKPNSIFKLVRFLGAVLMKIPMQLAGKEFVRKI